MTTEVPIQTNNQSPAQPSSPHNRKLVIACLVSGFIFFLVGFTSSRFTSDRQNIESIISEVSPTPTQVAIPTAIPITQTNQEPCSTNNFDYLKTVSLSRDICRLIFPLPGSKVKSYEFDYPSDWQFEVVGAEMINLSFQTPETEEDSLLLITTTDLPLDQSHLTTYSFEMVGPDPLIPENERVISAEIIELGDNQVLLVNTQLEEKRNSRYFLVASGEEESSLYMFNIKSNQDPIFISELETLLSSFHTFEIPE